VLEGLTLWSVTGSTTSLYASTDGRGVLQHALSCP
jgi:hypothetical protein